jgi:hypothetical protein
MAGVAVGGLSGLCVGVLELVLRACVALFRLDVGLRVGAGG